MEAIRKRLKLENTAIKIQAVSQLLRSVRTKLQASRRDPHTSPECPEKALLLELCAGTDAAVAGSCCNAVVTLVRDGELAYDVAIKALLNLIPTAESLSSIGAALCDLLVLQLVAIVESSGQYLCAYGIKDRPHPLITLVSTRPDSWSVICDQLERLLTMQDRRISDNVLAMLTPLLRYILLEPSQSPHFLVLRVIFIPTLIRVARKHDTSCRNVVDRGEPGRPDRSSLTLRLLGVLVDIVSFSQIGGADNVREVGQHLGCLLHAVTSDLSPCEEYQSLAQRLVHVVLEYGLTALARGHDISHLIDSVFPLTHLLSDEVILLHVVELLRVAVGHTLQSLLKLLLSILKNTGSLDPTLAAVIVLPVLQVINMPSVDRSIKSPHQTLATRVLSSIEYILIDHSPTKKYPHSHLNMSFFKSLTGSGRKHQSICHLARYFSSSPDGVHIWLGNLKSTLTLTAAVPYIVTCLVAAVLVRARDRDILTKCLDTLSKIVKIDTSQSALILPLLLYKSIRLVDPDDKLLMIKFVPKMASHHLAVPPILKTLQILHQTAELRAVTVTMAVSLWRQQERCLTHLEEFILATDIELRSSQTHMIEFNIARAASIRDICQVRPSQSGEDVLVALTQIIRDCDQTAAVVLALEGLYFLLQAEVIDITTVWAELSGQLCVEKRPLVVAAVCRLLSLVPELEVFNDEYKAFRSGVLAFLWGLTLSELPEVPGSAYEALSLFPRDDFRLSLLPQQIRLDVEIPENSSLEDQMEEPPVLGHYFTRLLKLVPDGNHTGYTRFLTELVKQEVSNMPRTLKSEQTSAFDIFLHKSLKPLPTFLQVEFERNKAPGLRGSLAVGVLMAYDPTLSTGRDGKPKPQQLIMRGRHYHQMLYALLQEVPVQCADWHQALFIPQAWQNFMHKCYHAYMQGQHTELSQQLARGQAQNPDDIEHKQKTVWLWARDKLTELICSVSSGSPTVQGNSLAALGALAVVVSKYTATLEADDLRTGDEDAEYLNHTQWLIVVMETLLCVLDTKHVTMVTVMHLCQLRSGGKRNACSALAQCGAGHGLLLMLPVMVASNADLVYVLLDALMCGLPGACTEHADQPVLHFHHALTLGLVLSRLFEEHFTETVGMKGMVSVWKTLDILEQCCLSDQNNRMGGLLGLSVCLVALGSDPNVNARAHVCSIQEQLSARLPLAKPTDAAYEGLCLCLAAVTGICYVNNLLGQTVVDQVVATLYQAHSAHNQMPGVALSLGLICNLLMSASHPTVGDLTIKLFGSWIHALEAHDLPTLQRLSFLKGAMSLAGADNIVFKAPSLSNTQSGVSVAELTKVVQNQASHGDDQNIQNSCIWQLGQLHMAAATVGQSRLSMPMTYHHLEKTSVVRALVDVLIEAGKSGVSAASRYELEAVLDALVHGPVHALPPLNWAGVLSPILRMPYGDLVEKYCLELAVNQSNASTSAALLLSSWILPPLWDTIKHKTQLMLVGNLPVLIKTIPLSKLKQFLEGDFTGVFMALKSSQSTSGDVPGLSPNSSAGRNTVFGESTSPVTGKDKQSLSFESTSTEQLTELALSTLKGLLSALRAQNPPQVVATLLFQTVQTIYNRMPVRIHVPLYTLLCQCLALVPTDLLDTITAQDFEVLSTYPRGMFVRAYMVASGCQPVAWINSAVEAYMCKTESNPRDCLLMLVHCFHGVHVSKAEYCSAAKCQTWLLELMGHMKNIVTDVVPVVGLQRNQVLRFILGVFSSAVCTWSGCTSALLTLAPIYLPTLATSAGTAPSGQYSDSLGDATEDSPLEDLLWNNLPPALDQMSQREPWKHITGKILDWLLMLRECPDVQNDNSLKILLSDCLSALRHTGEFRKLAVWGRVYS